MGHYNTGCACLLYFYYCLIATNYGQQKCKTNIKKASSCCCQRTDTVKYIALNGKQNNECTILVDGAFPTLTETADFDC